MRHTELGSCILSYHCAPQFQASFNSSGLAMVSDTVGTMLSMEAMISHQVYIVAPRKEKLQELALSQEMGSYRADQVT